MRGVGILEGLLGRPIEDVAVARWAPRLVKVSDPLADAEDAAAALDDERVPEARRSRIIERQLERRAGHTRTSTSGVRTYEGRECCLRRIYEVESILHQIKTPYEFACSCGCLYQVVGGIL